jgi:regulator of sirC expression with transglutaminase-like and TPR domain
MSDGQIKALIRLLSDDNERIVRTISTKLVEYGVQAVPLLQEAEIEQPEMAMRIAQVLDDIRGGAIEQELRALMARPDHHVDLEAGAFLLARYAYPTLDVPAYALQLDALAMEVRERVGARVSSEEAVKALGRYLFTEQGFRGNTKNYYEADNSYVNRVLDRRTGIPISLSILYLLVARRLRFPVFGVGMPGHFLVKFEGERYKVFIDCFNGGALLTEKDCARFLIQAGYGFDDKYLRKSSTRAILLRSMKNLIPIYQRMNDAVKEARLSRFVEVVEGEKKKDDAAPSDDH